MPECPNAPFVVTDESLACYRPVKNPATLRMEPVEVQCWHCGTWARVLSIRGNTVQLADHREGQCDTSTVSSSGKTSESTGAGRAARVKHSAD